MSRPEVTNIGSRPDAYGPAEWGLTLVVGLIWGSAFLWIAIAVDHIDPGVVAFSRVALGAMALAAFPMARRAIDREDWARVAVVAVIGNAAPAVLFAIAETELDSAVAGMITAGTPLLSLLFASVVLWQLPRPVQVVGITLGFVGTVMMAVPSLSGARAAPLGVVLVLIATVGYAVNSNIIVPLQQKYGGPAVMLWALIAASVILAPYGIATVGDSEFTLGSVVAVVILGVLGTGIVRALSTTLAGRVGGPRMTTTTYLIPVVAIVLGVVFLDEVVSPLAIAGVAIVILGAYAASRSVVTE